MKNLLFSLTFLTMLLFTLNVSAQDDKAEDKSDVKSDSKPENTQDGVMDEMQDVKWTFVGESDDYKVYLNEESVKKSGESETEYNFWLKMECKTDCNDGYKSISNSIQNWILYCDKKQYNVPEITDYYTDGEKNKYTNDSPSEIMENSPGEKIFNYFCNNKGSKD